MLSSSVHDVGEELVKQIILYEYVEYDADQLALCVDALFSMAQFTARHSCSSAEFSAILNCHVLGFFTDAYEKLERENKKQTFSMFCRLYRENNRIRDAVHELEIYAVTNPFPQWEPYKQMFSHLTQEDRVAEKLAA